MDKSKKEQLKRVFKRIVVKTHKELNKQEWSPQAENIIIDASVGQLMKEVTIRAKIA